MTAITPETSPSFDQVSFFDMKETPPMRTAVSAFVGPRDEDPAGYIASDDLTDAINAAILLGQPLLLTGEPGVGKTSVGRAVADRLSLPLLEFTVKSTSRAVDLFYEYDAVGRFQSAEADRAAAARLSALAALDPESVSADLRKQMAKQVATDPRRSLLGFIKVRALGRAILNASDPEAVRLLIDHELGHQVYGRRYQRSEPKAPGIWDDGDWGLGPRQSVVIIDEIDKAPSDFCNDLLDELDSMRFQVPELAIFSEGGDAPRFGGNLPIGLRPIVIITSNQERPLPDAFLRRCCYHHIRMPDGEGLQKILESRLSEASQLMKPEREAALEFFRGVRNLPGLTRSPGLAELLNWMRYIAFHKGDVARDQAFLVRSLTALIKDPSDAEKVRDWIGRSGS